MTRTLARDALVMAFDYGTQRIGVAVGQRITGTANGVTILTARDGVPDWHDVARLVREWQPALFVVGDPLHMDGTPSPMSARAAKFARRLEGRFGTPCVLVDERLSSFEARGSDTRGSQYKSAGSEPADALAAKLILETYFRTIGV